MLCEDVDSVRKELDSDEVTTIMKSTTELLKEN